MNLLELDAVIKNEGEVALDSREARQGLVTGLAQIVLIEAVEIDFGYEGMLLQFASGGHVRVNLAKLGNGRAIHDGAGRAAGMIVVGRLLVVIERPMGEGREQIFDVAFQVEK